MALKVHYETFYRPVNKQRDRAVDTRNSSLQELIQAEIWGVVYTKIITNNQIVLL